MPPPPLSLLLLLLRDIKNNIYLLFNHSFFSPSFLPTRGVARGRGGGGGGGPQNDNQLCARPFHTCACSRCPVSVRIFLALSLSRSLYSQTFLSITRNSSRGAQGRKKKSSNALLLPLLFLGRCAFCLVNECNVCMHPITGFIYLFSY